MHMGLVLPLLKGESLKEERREGSVIGEGDKTNKNWNTFIFRYSWETQTEHSKLYEKL